jgi:hypothetical protein
MEFDNLHAGPVRRTIRNASTSGFGAGCAVFLVFPEPQPIAGPFYMQSEAAVHRHPLTNGLQQS